MQELDVFRGIAILAVITIHATSSAVVTLEADSGMYWVYVAMNKLGWFAVPSFVFLSALVLTRRYQDGIGGFGQWSAYAKRRLSRVAVPYLVWSVLHNILAWSMGREFTPHRLIWLMVTGKSWAHLYFVALLFQFYAAFPILLTLFIRTGMAGAGPIWWVGAGAVIQAVFYVFQECVGPIYARTSLAPTFALFWFGGMAVGADYDRVVDAIRRNRRPVPVALALAVAGAVYVAVAAAPADVCDPVRVELARNVYAAICCPALIATAVGATRKGGRLALWLQVIGRASFGIYLVHPAILAGWRLVTFTGQPVLYHLGIVGGWVAALVGSLGIVALVRRSRWSWLVGGDRYVSYRQGVARHSLPAHRERMGGGAAPGVHCARRHGDRG